MRKPPENAETPAPAPETASTSVLPWKRLAAAFLAGIPFFCTLPYTFHSWRTSPMDRPNWIFHLAFLLLAACAVPAVKDSVMDPAKKRDGDDNVPLALLFAFAFFLSFLGATFVRQIHMARILAGMAFWWSCVWTFCGWRGAWALLPAFAVLALGCTSSTFLLCNHYLIQPRTVLFLKIGATLLCAAVCAILMLTDYVMKYGTFFFLLAVAIVVVAAMNLKNDVKPSPPYRPDLTAAPAGFTIAETPLSENTIRFFEGAEVHQYGISDGIFQCSILEVKCGDDIHKIHPASHCLRSGGAEVRSENVVMHTMPDGQKISVTEIRSNLRGTPILTFVWYTGPKETLGSYFWFRTHWSSSEQWYSYQIVTEIYDGSEDAARNFLLEVLSKFKSSGEYSYTPAIRKR